jgi:hypothetical protein
MVGKSTWGTSAAVAALVLRKSLGILIGMGAQARRFPTRLRAKPMLLVVNGQQFDVIA